MDGKSLDIKQARLQELKGLFPDLFAENQLDWEKLKAAFGDEINFDNEHYVLNWAGKSDAFKVFQQSTTATLKPIPEESINFDKSENLFIEGENKERIRRVIKEKTEKPDLFDKGALDLGFKAFKLSSSSFKIWRSQEITEENLEQQLDAFTNLARPGAEKQKMLYELMLKAGYELTNTVLQMRDAGVDFKTI